MGANLDIVRSTLTRFFVHSLFEFGGFLIGLAKLLGIRRCVFGLPRGKELERSRIHGAH